MKFKYLLLTFSLLSFTGNAQEIKAELKKEVKKEQKISYVLDYPQHTKGKVPLMIFLHGSGERGNDLDLVKAHSPFTYKKLFPEPVAILAPQCPAEVWWDTEAVYYLIKEIQKKYQIDDSRIMLTGLSMGGWGALKLAMEHPEIFSVVVPVCAPVDRLMTVRAKQYSNLPMKIFHGANDDIVPPVNAIEIYQAIKKFNNNVELVLFPDDNHNSWDSTYSNPKLYKWMLAQKKNIVKK